MPSKIELAEIYKEYYTEKTDEIRNFNIKTLIKYLLFKGMNKINILPIRLLCLKLASTLMQIVLPPPFGTKKVLDVGCGYGRLLDFFAMQGWQTYGVEPGLNASKYAKLKGHNIFTGELLETRYQQNYFSAVVFCHTLEHISNPVEVLNEVYRILEPGGLLVIEVPNIMSADAKFFGRSWDHYGLPFHVCHWTPASLGLVLTNIGFVIEHWKFKIPR
ncbi:MAG: class I SAM-dependent methyltransferase, partial [bacterium]